MHIGHPEASDDTPLVSKRVIRSRKGKIDDRFEAGLPNGLKLTLGGLASRAKLVGNGPEIVNLR